MAPDFTFEKETKKIPRYVTPDHFAAIYKAAGKATVPTGLPYSAGDWWRALLVMAYMTDWRISEVLYLRRSDVDLDAGTAIARAGGNKGGREEQVKLHPVVIEHLRKVPGFTQSISPWTESVNGLYKAFAAIQEAAGVKLPCRGEHEHTAACHVYGFHDFRRAFATMNADRLTGDALQILMRHKAYATTQGYINMTRQLDEAVDVLHVPEVLKAGGAR